MTGNPAQLGQYRIVRKLGEGGMGSVYEAVHERLQKRVAIKTMHPQIARDANAVARFVREGRAASRIRHPHVVDVSDVGTDAGAPYLVMELLDGESLARYLQRHGPLPVPTIADLMLPVLDALQAAHAEGVVHRDLKPENIFLSRGRGGEMHPKVLDFGISRIEDEVRLTGTAHFMGTPYYMSPEQAHNARSVDGRSDQFSLGLVIYELATGKRALTGNSVLEIVHKVSTDGAPRLAQARPDLPHAFNEIVDRMTARAPDFRFSSMREVGTHLLPFASPRGAALWSSAFAAAIPVTNAGGARPVITPSSSGSMRPPAFSVAITASPAAPSFNTPSSSPSLTPPSFSTPPPRSFSQPPAIGTDPTIAARGASSPPPPANTTFSSAAGESIRREPARSRGGLFVMAFLVLAIGGGIGAAYAAGVRLPMPSTAAPVVAAAAPVAAPPEAPVPVAPTTPLEVRVRAVPPGAELMLDGTSVGTGTYSASIVRDGIPHVLEVRADGYIPHRIEFLDVAPVATIELERIPHHHRGPVEARSSRMTETGLVEAPPTVTPPPITPSTPAGTPHEHEGAGSTTQTAVVGGGSGHGGAQSTTSAPTPEATPAPEAAPEAPPPPAPPAHDDDDWGGPQQDLQPFE